MPENGTAYLERVGNRTFYPGGSLDPVRANMPYTPVEAVPGPGRPSVPILGVLALVAIALWFEHMRRRRGR